MNIGWRRGLAEDLRVLTLGNGSSWRMIEDFPPHAPESLDLCIDGVLYYEAYLDTYPAFLDEDKAVMSFDVRSEKFHLIKTPETALFTKLTRYEGKLAIMGSESTGLSTCRIDMWVLVDAAKHEWSNKVFVVPCEFVLAPETMFHEPPFYVLYYDPKKNAVRRFFIEGITELKLLRWDSHLNRRVISIFPGQVENLMFL
ncbi:F-box protein At2g21930 [Arabidopsis lyrata subsp. lyrata]|uniref:F-box protein At2g21930 n=1 Tax=Arabidopsis lyrata subsp. lyrata TaxID=81972 RepID=UPI000A29E700|nr:F-box protein At2g21930 [Arabidopsis lyrata subsp. lyrata]|eukprot:XP_020887845.1 F-box protein At2g21930 [Arabidopsis lyrata subsp. lyrata]